MAKYGTLTLQLVNRLNKTNKREHTNSEVTRTRITC